MSGSLYIVNCNGVARTEVVLERLLARGKRLGDFLTRRVVLCGGELGRKLGLERAAMGKRQKGTCEYEGCNRTV